MNPVTIYLRGPGITRNLKDKFKAVCASKGTDMTKAIVQFMKDTVAADEKQLKGIQNEVRRDIDRA